MQSGGNMDERRIRLGAYITVLVLGIGAALYLFFKHVALALLPFLIAWAVAFATRPASEAISKKIKIPKRALRGIFAALAAVGFIGAVCLLVWALASELWRLLGGLGDGEVLRELVDGISSLGIIGELFNSFGDRLADVFYELLVSVATSLGGAVTGMLGAVPKLLLFIIITVIASVYFALDLEKINAAAFSLLPSGVCRWLSNFRRGFFKIGLKYLRSYLLLMLLTFAIMLVGLLILGRPYALLLAFVIAALDILPVLGVGTVLLPWGIYELALGDSRIGIGLFILFAVYELLRQLAEPRILGRQLGVHPILTLLLVYVCYTVFGFAGILLVPITVVLANVTLSKNNSAKVGESTASEHDRA